MKHRNYGNCVVQATSSLNLGKCHDCGTYNPSIPGQGMVEVCAGCGHTINRECFAAPVARFTPPKITPDVDDGMSVTTNRRRRYDQARIAGVTDHDMVARGSGGLGRKTAEWKR